jgi:hypothetical protein
MQFDRALVVTVTVEQIARKNILASTTCEDVNNPSDWLPSITPHWSVCIRGISKPTGEASCQQNMLRGSELGLQPQLLGTLVDWGFPPLE